MPRAGVGFTLNASQRAAVATNNKGAEAAIEWCFSHNNDADFNDPLPAASAPASIDPVRAPAKRSLSNLLHISKLVYC
jgi:ubiquitin carboxyl-terminal hydrolase 5/13